MKPFNIELAKANHSVQTKDGHQVRIVCYDRKHKYYPIVALIMHQDGSEITNYYTIDGKFYIDKDDEYDLVMASTKKEGWINIYHSFIYVAGASNVYETKEEALKGKDEKGYVTTVKIEWEE